ncbi:helix-turn-helix transcriptional regulator [Priestia megaterium]|uniref:helix-turn-helix domain-containing protein n=2 Tax=Bacillaceae TaxID=186817 RepID=UPI00234E6D36|nr:helix-turn-helix transcriptional regulator [Priestia megaterium]MDC7772478.1 helix-turn-helix transcriptional regulator [Priestia megaterium]
MVALVNQCLLVYFPSILYSYNKLDMIGGINVMNLSYNLKRNREKNNLSQESVARELNISRQSISKWENGNCYPDLDNLIKLSDLYSVSLDELIKGDKDFQKKIIIKKTEEKNNIKKPWWIIFAALGMIYGLIQMILN